MVTKYINAELSHRFSMDKTQFCMDKMELMQICFHSKIISKIVYIKRNHMYTIHIIQQVERFGYF